MNALLALRNLVDRPWRTLFLLFGYATGVGVMITLLSVGEALMTQARDEKLVGGGEITVLPEGVDVELLKTGGLGGMFFSIDHARFVYRQLLASPRLASQVAAVAPQVEGKLLYLRPVARTGAAQRELPVRATGEIPSRGALVGGAASLASGTWADDDGDRRWRDPTPAELRHEIDHFHQPMGVTARDESWGEWHYFNVVSADRKRWAFITLMVGGAMATDRWSGQVLVTLHAEGRPARRFVHLVPKEEVRFSTSRADLDVGESSVRVLPDGRYTVRATAPGERDGAPLSVDLVVSPAAGAYFPGAALGGDAIVSGYAVAALRADASGSICVARSCERFETAPSYHDHNWGTWRGVTWEWGSARAGGYSLLYGRVQPPDSVAATQPLFVYLVDSLGFLALFRPRAIVYTDSRTVVVDGRAIRVPSRAVMMDARGDDTLRIELEVEDATATDTRRPRVERGDADALRGITRPYFVQMKGVARITGRVGGRVLAGAGTGFFETYR
ncbi:MAG: hypothetical protein ACYC1S_06065 [Gemmatimonadaceae bacterium]